MLRDKYIIVFDDCCVLCNGFVKFLIKRDKKDIFRFASLQNTFLETIVMQKNISHIEPNSVVLITPNNDIYQYSDAVINILSLQGGVYRFAKIFKIIPKFIRNGIYKIVAKYRYVLFPKTTSCSISDSTITKKMINR